MKYLFLMQGIPGIGKSHYLKQDGLKDCGLVVSSDLIRQLYSTDVVTVTDREVINFENDSKVWKTLFEIVEFRMSKSYTTIVDATHYSLDSIKKYKSLCQQYEYQLFVVRLENNLEKAIEQNKNRPSNRQVPEEVLKKMYDKIEEEKDSYPKWINVIDIGKMMDMMYNGFEPFDYNHYEKIHIFGDIHGCQEPLDKFFKQNPIVNNELYIFTGDYLDRGIQNKEVLNFLLSIKDLKNVKFLEGNHEKWLRLFAKDKISEIRSPEFMENTLDQIKDFDKNEIKNFCKKLASFFYFTYRGCNFVITHGGITSTPNLMFTENDYIKGIGKYQDMQIVDETFSNQKFSKKIYSIHGHRNIEKVDAHNTEYTFNLEGRVEFGEYLRVLTIQEISSELPLHFGITLIKNDTFRDPDSNIEIVKKLRRNPLIKVKKLADGLESFNFSEKAFFDKEWNSQTITARGLFIDTETSEIVARSYDKFFNFNELPETTEEQLTKTLKFPVTASLKENGYLGILSWNFRTNDFIIATKSQTSGPHTDNFKRILKEDYQIDDNEDLKQLLKFHNITLIFEVIDPIFDPHIIKYDNEKVVLLDIVENEFKARFSTYEEVLKIAEMIGCEAKRNYCIFKTPFELFHYLKSFPTTGRIEGFVLTDSVGYRFKFKTPFYTFWKLIRNSFARPNQTVRDLFESRFPEEFKYIDSISEEYRAKFVKNNQFKVIDFYTEFYNGNGFSTRVTTKSAKI